MKLHSTFTILLFSAITTALPQTPETAPPQDKSKELFFQTFFNRRGGVFRDPKYHRISTASLNETHMLEISLDWFAENLKSYVYPSYFDFASFDKDSRILAQDLRAIGNLRETRGPFNVEILKSYSFIDNMFSEMLYASSKLKQYSLSGGKAYTLLTYMIELNIRLLSIRTSQGTLDISVPGHDKALRGFWREMCSWDDDFLVLENVPIEIRILFGKQMANAEATIRTLWRQIPGQRPSLFWVSRPRNASVVLEFDMIILDPERR